ncbi:tail fiber protein [Variovorax sp. PMC12]|uniref:hyaluronate lyase N-terminal domain-containing protein n=1 Tax=Variovorax sp. PMC12 TaxID=2126319 RepID=UPI00131D7F1F|nr:tail fiber protein [Variovorax sp. PMC12]
MPATILQLRSGTTAQHATFTGALAEVTVDITKKTLVVHDGATVGGKPLMTATEVATAITNAVAAAFPPGTFAWTLRPAAPSGYLKANGSAISVSAYPELTAAIYCGDAYNATAAWGYRATSSTSPATNRSTTGAFLVLPDVRAEFIRGYDDGRGIDTAGRSSMYVLQSGQNAAHTHTFQNTPDGDFTNGGGYRTIPLVGVGSQTLTTSSSGGTEARPRNVTFLPCIKY